MATVTKNNAEEPKQIALSPRLKGRGMSADEKRQDPGLEVLIHGPSENTKETLCRNVTIYGKCRYEDKGDCSTEVLHRISVD